MKSVYQARNLELRWKHVHVRRKDYTLPFDRYELDSGGELFASMYEKASTQGLFANIQKPATVGETTDGVWTIKQYQRRIVATEIVSHREVAILERVPQVQVTFSTGRVMTRKLWRVFGKVWRNEGGILILRRGSIFRRDPITIETAGFSLEELSLLILLDRYLSETERVEFSQDVARSGGVAILS